MNDYLWMAPILVQASIEATAIGDVGMYMMTTSPFFTPLFVKTCAIWQVILNSLL